MLSCGHEARRVTLVSARPENHDIPAKRAPAEPPGVPKRLLDEAPNRPLDEAAAPPKRLPAMVAARHDPNSQHRGLFCIIARVQICCFRVFRAF